jgi:hypothetical protein
MFIIYILHFQLPLSSHFYLYGFEEEEGRVGIHGRRLAGA